MPWQIEVLIRGEWKPVGTGAVRAGGQIRPYAYDSQEHAERMADMCYPDQRRLGGDGTVRVREVP